MGVSPPTADAKPPSPRARVAHAGGGLVADASLDVAAAVHLAAIQERFDRARLAEVQTLLERQGDAVARLRPFATLGVSEDERWRRILDAARRHGRDQGYTHFGLALDPDGAVVLFARRIVAVAPPRRVGRERFIVAGRAPKGARLEPWTWGPCPRPEAPCAAEPHRGRVEEGPRGRFATHHATPAVGWWALELMADVGEGPEVAFLRWVRVGQARAPVEAQAPALARAADGGGLEAPRGPATWLASLREERARSPTADHPALASAAGEHAAHVCSAGWATHVGPGGDRPDDRARAHGFEGRIVETVAIAASLARAWHNLLGSPSHLAGLLDPVVDSHGVGTAVGPEGHCLVVLLGGAAP